MFKLNKLPIVAIVLLLILCAPVWGQILEAVDFATNEPGSSYVSNMVISPDGRHLYALAEGTGTLASYSINQETGALTQFDLQDVEPVIFPTSAISQFTPDGRFLYARRTSDRRLMLYARDLTNGQINLVDENVANLDGQTFSRRFTLSPDGNNLYLTTASDTGVLLFVFEVNPDGSLNLLQVIDPPGGPTFPVISPDGVHLYLTGNPNPFFERNPIDGTLQLAGNELTAPPFFGNMLFTRDSELFLFSRAFIGSPPGFGLGYFQRDSESGEAIPPSIGVLGSRAIINSSDLFSFIDNERFLVQSVPRRLFRFIREADASFEVEGGIVDNLSTGTAHQFTSQLVSPTGEFYFLGLEEGIVVFRINPTGIGNIPSVPALSFTGLLAVIFLILTGALIFNRKRT